MEKLIIPPLTVGIDLGDKQSHVCVLNAAGTVTARTRIGTSKAAFQRAFRSMESARVVLEVGTHSAWVVDVLTACGHEAIVANARQLEAITKNVHKNDENDAELLARLGRSDLELMKTVRHRDPVLRADLSSIRARDGLVRSRTSLINVVRGIVKPAGGRIPKCSAEAFHNRAAEGTPTELWPAVEPLIKVIAETTRQIKAADKNLKAIAKKYPEVALVSQISGVGDLTALAFILTLGDRTRFKRSRDVGPYLGLVPKQQQSGKGDPQLRITKAGNALVRRLLVGASHYVLGRFGPDTDLRRWGLSIAARGGKNGKKRAVVAVARKLAVLMHRLWSTGEVYEPLRSAKNCDGNNED